MTRFFGGTFGIILLLCTLRGDEAPITVRKLASFPGGACTRLFSEPESAAPFDVDQILPEPWTSLAPVVLELSEIQRYSEATERAQARYREYRERTGQENPNFFFSELLKESRLRVKVAHPVLDLPSDRPILFVANHPTGAIDGIAMMEFATRFRPATFLVATQTASAFTALRPYLIAVDKTIPRGDTPAQREAEEARIKRNNLGALRKMTQTMIKKQALTIFPAGKISRWDFQRNRPVDYEWKEIVGQFMLKYSAIAVPVYIHLANSIPFYLVRRAQGPSMMLETAHISDQGIPVEMTVGTPVDASQLAEKDPARIARELQLRMEALAP